jgi:hypothetical protein
MLTHTLAAILASALLPSQQQPPALTPMMQSANEMAATMESAQKASIHTGDDLMTCNAIQHELVSVAQDPALQQTLTRMGERGKAQQEKLAAAQSENARGASAAQMFSGFAAALVPGAGRATMAAEAAQAQTQAAEAAQNQAALMTQMQAMVPLMPKLMRGQRLYELAVKRNCDWLTGAPVK